MGIRQNIFISIIIHTMVIASVLFVGCRIRDTAYCVPATYMVVSLFKEMTGITNAPSSAHQLPPRRKEKTNNKESVAQEPILNNARDLISNHEDREKENVSENSTDKSALTVSLNQHPGISGERTTLQANKENDGNTVDQDTKDLFAIIRNAIEKAKIYPLLARKRKIEGTVITGFTIDNKGHPQTIKIAKSSGHTILDSAAIKIVKNAAPLPFVKGEIIVPISFRLTDHQTYTYR